MSTCRSRTSRKAWMSPYKVRKLPYDDWSQGHCHWRLELSRNWSWIRSEAARREARSGREASACGALREILCLSQSVLGRNYGLGCAASGNIASGRVGGAAPHYQGGGRGGRGSCGEHLGLWQCARSHSDQRWSQPSLHGQSGSGRV